MAEQVSPPENMQELFQPTTLCARCDEEESGPIHLFVETENGGFTLNFCSLKCRTMFEQGFSAAQELKEG